jgi:hypothetical protein
MMEGGTRFSKMGGAGQSRGLWASTTFGTSVRAHYVRFRAVLKTEEVAYLKDDWVESIADSRV